MSEDTEDLNDFNGWDILGAMLFLMIVPAILNYVFNEKDVVGSSVLAGVGVLLSLAVFGLFQLTRWRLISRIVNFLGVVLTTLYIAVAVYCWVWGGEDETAPTEEVQAGQPRNQ